MPHDQDDQRKEYRQPNGKGDHIGGAVDYCPGNRGFYCSHRAKPAEIEWKGGAEEEGDKDKKSQEYPVLDEPSPSRDLKLDVRDLVEKFLHEPKGAGPAAQEPSRNQSGQGYPANYRERENAQ